MGVGEEANQARRFKYAVGSANCCFFSKLAASVGRQVNSPPVESVGVGSSERGPREGGEEADVTRRRTNTSEQLDVVTVPEEDSTRSRHPVVWFSLPLPCQPRSDCAGTRQHAIRLVARLAVEMVVGR